MIRLDFEDTYALMECDEDLKSAAFVADLKNGDKITIRICMETNDLGWGFTIFNLVFGPVKSKGRIDVYAKIQHKNIEKLFSTILMHVWRFLQKYPSDIVGIDGTTDSRAYMYHRIFLSNAGYLQKHMKALGVDWFAKQLRNGTLETHKNGDILFRPRFEAILRARKPVELYGYYLLTFKHSHIELNAL